MNLSKLSNMVVYAGTNQTLTYADVLDSSKVASRVLATSTELTNWLYKMAAHPVLPFYIIQRKANKNHYYHTIYCP
jgi:S-adenosylmethionine:tRNA-ribosyltransferase-isomerase (queuine synthetase)